MNPQELKDKYYELYEYMAQSKDPKNMKLFGKVMTMMFDDMAQAHTQKAEEYINILEGVKWRNYLSPSEADKIVAAMEPKAPWTREQWIQAMQNSGFELEEWPYYNRCALFTTMEMIMSDSSETLSKYVEGDKMFEAVHALAVDKLKDPDERFSIRSYFGL